MHSAATGIDFQFAGTTHTVPSQTWGMQPTADFPTGYAPILVGWSRPGVSDLLTGGTHVGTGYPIFVEHTLTKHAISVSGVIALDADASKVIPTGFAGETLGGVVLHEIGHVLNLAHVQDIQQMMFPELTVNSSRLGDGDKAGLAEVGSAKGCIDVPPAPWDQQAAAA
jgi:hypothetical protein